jgi:hypothetical protein
MPHSGFVPLDSDITEVSNAAYPQALTRFTEGICFFIFTPRRGSEKAYSFFFPMPFAFHWYMFWLTLCFFLRPTTRLEKLKGE